MSDYLCLVPERPGQMIKKLRSIRVNNNHNVKKGVKQFLHTDCDLKILCTCRSGVKCSRSRPIKTTHFNSNSDHITSRKWLGSELRHHQPTAPTLQEKFGSEVKKKPQKNPHWTQEETLKNCEGILIGCDLGGMV